MRIPLGYRITGTSPAFRAGAIYIEVQNLSDSQLISIAFDIGTNPIDIAPGQTRIFPLLGSQGYANFLLTNDDGGAVESAFVMIIN